ncbi:MAG: hypothetical protein ACFFBV_16605 [Promethearchaeota archaeon]
MGRRADRKHSRLASYCRQVWVANGAPFDRNGNRPKKTRASGGYERKLLQFRTGEEGKSVAQESVVLLRPRIGSGPPLERNPLSSFRIAKPKMVSRGEGKQSQKDSTERWGSVQNS